MHPAPFTVLRQDYQGPASNPVIDRGAERQAGTTAVRHKSVEQMPGFREN